MQGQRPQRGYLGVGLQPLDENLAPCLGLPKDSGEIVRSVVAERPGGTRRAAAGRRHRERERPAGHPRPDRLVPRCQYPCRLARPARDHPRRASAPRSTCRSASVRPRKLSPRSAAATHYAGWSGVQRRARRRRLWVCRSRRSRPELARAANLPASARGVIITAVDPNSDAGEEGLQRGDLIVSVNNQLVTTPAQVVAAVDSARRTRALERAAPGEARQRAGSVRRHRHQR